MLLVSFPASNDFCETSCGFRDWPYVVYDLLQGLAGVDCACLVSITIVVDVDLTLVNRTGLFFCGCLFVFACAFLCHSLMYLLQLCYRYSPFSNHSPLPRPHLHVSSRFTCAHERKERRRCRIAPLFVYLLYEYVL